MPAKRAVFGPVPLMVAAATFLGPLLHPATGVGQAPAPAMHDGRHNDLEYTAPPEEQKSVRIIGDERFKDEPITVSPSRKNGGVVYTIEGDMIVGQESELLRANLNELRQEALLINLEDENLRELLGPEGVRLVQIVRALPAPENEEALLRATVGARLGPLYMRLVQLVRNNEDSDLIPEELVEALHAMPPRASASAIMGARFRWPRGVIPYYYDRNTMPPQLQQTIEEAVAHWNRKTDRIFLRPARQSDPYYVNFIASNVCQSHVGKVVNRGPQPIYLGPGCAFDQVVHEIGHAVGLFHEQTRNDRNKYLNILIQNAIAGSEANFQQPLRTQAQDVAPFDFASVMLYGPDAFSASGQPTMVVQPAYRQRVGNVWGLNHRGRLGLRGLSRGDVAGVASMYPEKAIRDPNFDLNSLNPSSAPETVQPAGPHEDEAQHEATPSERGRPAMQGAPAAPRP